ncbi:MAG TPA: hypothetical protein VN193_01445 [Candidatus Angelobacter sp.]|jgi:hypothetical protein|nr:hypothetical protein [Candidatus Angelobacter sp.]
MAYTTTRDVVVGALCVILGCAAAAASIHAARRTRNWLFYICALGAVAFVAGVVGQSVFPSEDAQKRDPLGATKQTPGVWDAGVQIPVIGIQATPLAVGGFLVAVVGLSLVLFFEVVPSEEHAARPPRPSALVEDPDTV